MAKAKAAPAVQRQVTRVETVVTETEDEQPQVSLDLQNADLGEVLRMLAKQAKVKIVIGNDVKGTVSASLHNMPLDKMLDSILAPHDLTWRRKDDGTYVIGGTK